MARGLLVAGTASDAGKSLVTAGICRLLVREGLRVAPFKSQNLSNNSMVCPDGSEIGRSQWLQAVAARVTPEAAMNPVLLKPGSDRRSHIVLMGQPWGSLGTGEPASGRRALAERAFAAFDDLASRFDVVIAEGAGSPAEVNLRAGDYVNLGLARAKDLPVIVVGDIDRGGVLAAMYGTLALLDAADQDHLRGWVVNKFRGDLELLRPGLRDLEERTGRPVLGVLPFLRDVWLDSEDVLAIGGWARSDVAGARAGTLRIAAVRLPRISNATDLDALAAEPGVEVVLTDRPDDVAGADLVVLPGSRATLNDLGWLRSRGLDQVVRARAAAGLPVLGICGGHQMLAEVIVDRAGVESREPVEVPGLSLLPTMVEFRRGKHLGTPEATWHGTHVTAYEIHHGVVSLARLGADREADLEEFLDGWRRGSVYGTTWHGAFESDDFRRAFLAEVAVAAGKEWRPDPEAPGYVQRRDTMLDRLADSVGAHVGSQTIMDVIDDWQRRSQSGGHPSGPVPRG